MSDSVRSTPQNLLAASGGDRRELDHLLHRAATLQASSQTEPIKRKPSKKARPAARPKVKPPRG